MAKKTVLFTLVTVIIAVILLEAGLGILFYFKDVRVLTLGTHVKDAPYVYYLQDYANGIESGPAPDKYRIALLGGSVARHLGSFDLLDSVLSAGIGSNVIEIIDAGIDGYVVQQEFLLTQLHIQKYKPNLVISIDGYNDLKSYSYNRYVNDFPDLPPQNYRDFQVIKKGKLENSFIHRFAALFKNVTRAIEFVHRFVTKQSMYDFSQVTDAELKAYGDIYAQRITDIRDFCAVKGMNYFTFVQPIRFYDNRLPFYLRDENYEKRMTELYYIFERNVIRNNLGFSLTGLFDSKMDVYLDDCHVNREGNLMITEAISQHLTEIIKNDTAFIRIQSKTKLSTQ